MNFKGIIVLSTVRAHTDKQRRSTTGFVADRRWLTDSREIWNVHYWSLEIVVIFLILFHRISSIG